MRIKAGILQSAVLTSPSQSALYWKVSFRSGKSYYLTRTGLAQKEPTEGSALKDSLGEQPQHISQPHAHSFQRTFPSPTLTYPQQTVRVTQQSKRASNREERSQNKNIAQLGNSIYAERRPKKKKKSSLILSSKI